VLHERWLGWPNRVSCVFGLWCWGFSVCLWVAVLGRLVETVGIAGFGVLRGLWGAVGLWCSRMVAMGRLMRTVAIPVTEEGGKQQMTVYLYTGRSGVVPCLSKSLAAGMCGSLWGFWWW
jgi:hypothetical protein